MSLSQEKETKEENEEKTSNFNNQNNYEKPSEPLDTIENHNIETTEAYFNIKEIENNEQLKNLEKAKADTIKEPNNKSIDYSTLVLKKDEINMKESLVELNIKKTKNEINEIKKNDISTNPNQNFMQRTKSWMSNIWTNVKNYNYRNMFKKTEMEDVLDAHGNHIKLPKNRKEKALNKIKNDGENFIKYGDINYNTYYASSNVNVFYGYPF